MHTRLIGKNALALAVACLSVTAPAIAQELVIEEIVVTAQKRESALQDTPVTVSAIGGDTIEATRLRDINSFFQLIPNANVSDSGFGQNKVISIRGTREVDPQAEPAYGLFRNGIYIGGPRTNIGAMVDVSRMEVLRGPQGGLYGRNAVGGAVNIVYNTPGDDFAGHAALTVQDYDRQEVELMINAPVTDTFAIRAAGWYYNQDEGEYKDSLQNTFIDTGEDKGIRLMGRWELGDTVTLDLTYEKLDGSGAENRLYAPSGIVNGVSLVDFGPLVSDPETPETIQRNAPNTQETAQDYFAGTLTWDTDAGTYNLLASYRDYELQSISDFDRTPFSPSEGIATLERTQTRHTEVKDTYIEFYWLSPTDWKLNTTAGISFLDEEFRFDRGIPTSIDLDLMVLAGIIPPAPPPLPGWGVAGGTGLLLGQIDTESVSAFAEVTYPLTDSLDLMASIRYTEDKKTLAYSQLIADLDPITGPIIEAIFAPQFPTYVLNTSDTFDAWTPGVGLNYQLNDDMMLYGLVSTGFRAGSYNTTSTDPALLPYDEETAINYELGMKMKLADGRVVLNLAAFRFDQDDVLLRAADPVNPTFSSLQNVGESETLGFEAELTALLGENLALTANFGWLDAEITEGEASQGFQQPPLDVSGNQIPFVRDWTGSLVLDYNRALNERWSLLGALMLRTEHGGYLSLENQDSSTKYEDLTVVNLTAGVQAGSLRIVGYVDNATDETIRIFSLLDGSSADTFGRRYGVKVSYDF